MAFRPTSRAAIVAESAPRTGAHAAVQRKLAQEHALVERLAEKMTHAASQTQCHRQIERRAFFTNVGGSEVDRNALAMRKLERAVSQRRLDALAAFFHGVVGKTHHVEIVHARGAYIYFHFNNVGVNPIHGGAERFEEHNGAGREDKLEYKPSSYYKLELSHRRSSQLRPEYRYEGPLAPPKP